MNTAIFPRWLVLLLATSVGVIAANLYYAQPLISMISHSIGVEPKLAGMVVTLTQAGYGIGVLCLAPLGDILESRKLVITSMAIAVVGLLGLAYVSTPLPYFLAAFATGLGTSGVQVIVPYAAHFAPDEKRGQVLGTLMSGLMMGIMLSRPTASLLCNLFGWHSVFVLSAGLMILIAASLMIFLPPKNPSQQNLKYHR